MYTRISNCNLEDYCECIVVCAFENEEWLYQLKSI